MAQQLFDNGDVQKENADTFVCEGSNGRQYEISKVNDPKYNYKYYCKCPAWKFDTTRECKHVLAVQIFEKQNGGSYTNSKNRTTKKNTGSISIVKKGKVVRKQTVKNNYKTKKDGNKNTMDWTEPDGSKTKFKFDEDGNLIGKVSK